MEGNLHFQIDWATLIVGIKYFFFALFYFEFEGNFPSTNAQEAYIWRGDLTEVFCITALGALYVEGFTHKVAYFLEFYGISAKLLPEHFWSKKIIFQITVQT